MNAADVAAILAAVKYEDLPVMHGVDRIMALATADKPRPYDANGQIVQC